LVLGEIVERMLAQQLIHSGVELMAGTRREIRRGNPYGGLPVAFPFAHRHAECSTVVPDSDKNPGDTQRCSDVRSLPSAVKQRYSRSRLASQGPMR
jgi:hypothetical protein